MSHDPETRPSLIARLQQEPGDAAWEEFVSIYRPVVLRLAGRCGLQPDDAEDVAQGVMLSVARHIATWRLDPERAKFRTWFHRIVRNAALNAVIRRPADRGVGGTTALQSLEAIAGDRAGALAEFETEWRREAFQWASSEVRNEFAAATWSAFQLTAVEGLEPAEVARRLGKSVGAVYVARCRVMQRIQARLRDLDETDSDIQPRQVAGVGP